MDWNLRPSSSSSLWEWDNFFDLDNPKRLQQQSQSQVQHSFESLHSPAGSGSDLGSKSSLSACESKTSNTNTNPHHHHHSKLTFGGSTPSPGGEPLLSLKLGKRMYFKTPSPSAATSSSVLAVAGKRSKSGGGCRTGQAPRCQVEGCGLDLSEAKDYHKKHRICENHSKSPRVVVNGIERRFCQQCSRFHGLSEFDEKKRSCRRRLSDHNARRRKPQPDPVRLNPVRFTTSLYDGPQKMSLYASQGSRFSWGLGSNEDNSSKFGLTREYFSSPCSKTISAVGSEIPGNLLMLYPHLGSTRPIANKVTAPEFLQPESNETHDLHRALSLLSTSCWGSNSREGKPVLSSQANNNTNNNNDVASSHGVVVPFGSSEVWLNDQQTTLIATEQPPPPVTVSQMIPRGSSGNGNSHFHDLHLFKPPTESGYYSYQF